MPKDAPTVALPPVGLTGYDLDPGAAFVRSTYRQMTRWAASRGYPRTADQTPYEYLGMLSAALPELVQDLRSRGIELPVLLRISDILEARVKALAGTFAHAIEESGYTGRYRPVFPIKVNQQRDVVEELVEFGEPHALGLEAGSKPELMAVMGLSDDGNECVSGTDSARVDTEILDC